MASTIAIATSFQIEPEKLKTWATGDKPIAGEELNLYEEIFSQFKYVDGEWQPIEAKSKKTKTTKTKSKKKSTKKAASTTDSEAASTKHNTESIVPEKTSDVAPTEEIKVDKQTVATAKNPINTTSVVSADTLDSSTKETAAPEAKKPKNSKTKKKSVKKEKAEIIAEKQPTAKSIKSDFAIPTAKDNLSATEVEKPPLEMESDKNDSERASIAKIVTEKDFQPQDNKSARSVTKDDRTTTKEDKPSEAVEAKSDKSDSAKSDEEKEAEDMPNKVFFTAVGMIRGEVKFDDVENQHTVKFGGKTYPLFYARKNYTAFTGLKKEIESTGNSTQRLIVYPKFTHFPKKEQPPRVGFQLVGFDKGAQPLGITSELKDNEFKLCGIWQFIPVCRQPCISIFRNFNRDRLDYIKQAEVQSKVNFMKASHLPVLWRDGPVRPFRFNPRLEKDQQAKTYFVQIKAKFLPQRDCFGFSESLADPIEKPPKFLKASKADKAEVMKKVAKNKPPGKGLPPGRGKPPARSGNKPSGPKKVINKPVGKSAPGKQQ